MIDSNDTPGAVGELPFNLQLTHRVHQIPVMRAFGVQVPAFPKGMHDAFVSGGYPNHQPATLVGIRGLRMRVNFTQTDRTDPQHLPSLALPLPPLNRIVTDANSFNSSAAAAGA